MTRAEWAAIAALAAAGVALLFLAVSFGREASRG